MPEIIPEFRKKHILEIDTNAKDIEHVCAAINQCRNRQQGISSVSANTVLCMSKVDLLGFRTAPVSTVSVPKGVYLSPVIPLAVQVGQSGTITAYTSPRFTYSLDGNSKVSHFVGLRGGRPDAVNTCYYHDVKGLRLFLKSKFPNTRGFHATGVYLAKKTGLQNVAHNNEEYVEIKIQYCPERPANLSETFYVKHDDLICRASSPWIKWAGSFMKL
jgi:hypothetical protein